jgi:hypothetical protein
MEKNSQKQPLSLIQKKPDERAMAKKSAKIFRKHQIKVAPRAGLEPATKWLTATCSTTELPRKTWK